MKDTTSVLFEFSKLAGIPFMECSNIFREYFSSDKNSSFDYKEFQKSIEKYLQGVDEDKRNRFLAWISPEHEQAVNELTKAFDFKQNPFISLRNAAESDSDNPRSEDAREQDEYIREVVKNDSSNTIECQKIKPVVVIVD